MAKFNSTSMIEIKVGDKILETARQIVVVVKHISIVPNGNIYSDKSLVAIIAADIIDIEGLKIGRIIATADKFEPIPENFYEELYPSSLLDKE